MNKKSALVAGASPEEFAHLQSCLSDLDCIDASLNDDEKSIHSIDTRPTGAIVFDRKDARNALDICEQLRNFSQSSAAPILFIISRYKLIQGNAVSRKGNAAFVIAPFGEKELRDKCNSILNST